MAEPKPKEAGIRVLDPATPEGEQVLQLIARLCDDHHEHLAQAHFAVEFVMSWSEDRDGNTPLGKLVLVKEETWRLLEAAGVDPVPDFLLQLNGQLWPQWDEAARAFVLDSQLCFAAEKVGKDGEQLEDETGRKLWRKVGPEFIGFAAPIVRHLGTVEKFRNLTRFVGTLQRQRQLTLPSVGETDGGDGDAEQ